MKKFLKIFGIIFVLLLGILVAAPFLFKDKIKKMVQDEINHMLHAEVYFGDVGLSFIRNFPNATISIKDFGVVGVDDFEEDTLAQGKQFRIVADIMSVISGDKIDLKKILLEKPKIHAIVLPDGRPNWDIVKMDSTVVEEDTAAAELTNFNLKLKEYRISNADIIFDDAATSTKLIIRNLTHKGKGDFTATTYNVRTNTTADAITLISEGVRYANKLKLDTDINLNVSTAEDLVVKILENTININDLSLGFDGEVALRGDATDVDVNFHTKRTDFKSILSLVPGIYTKDFSGIKADGSLALKGFVKGRSQGDKIPGIGLDLTVSDASFQYPDLPTPVSGINVDTHIKVPENNMNATSVEVNKFHANFGNNPIDAKLSLKGLENMNLDGNVKAKLNLEELTSIFPLDGLTLKGMFDIDADAKGVYNEAKGTFPNVDAAMKLSDGYAKSSDYPAELKNINMNATLINKNGSMENTILDMPRFHFDLDEETIDGNVHVENLDNPKYKIGVKGALDLEKLIHIAQIEDLDVKGKIIVEDFETSGVMSDLEAEKYDKLPTHGTMRLQNIHYASADLPAPVDLKSGTASFTPSKIEVKDIDGKMGSSDFKLNGYLSNYLAYAFMNEPIKGELALNSNKLDLNELMVEGAEPTETTQNGEVATPPAEGSMSVIPVPENIDVNFQADIKEVIYDNMDLKNFKGGLNVAHQTVSLKDVGFKMLGGTMKMNGSYNTQNLKHPAYDFDMDISQLGIKDAFKQFSTVKTFAPIAQYITGFFNTTVNLSGTLDSHMNPEMQKINSKGKFQVQEGAVEGMPMMNKISATTKLKDFKKLQLQDILAAYTIKNGILTVSPFDIATKKMAMNFGGEQNLTGAMNYNLRLDVPAGNIAKAAQSALMQMMGSNEAPKERIVIDLKLGGTVNNPKITGMKSNLTNDIKSQIQDQLEAEIEDKIKDQLGIDVDIDSLDDKIKDEIRELEKDFVDSMKNVVANTKDNLKDSSQQVIQDIINQEMNTNDVKDKLEDEVKDKLNDIFGGWKKKKKK